MSPLSINERVTYIKDNETEINSFVEEYKPFIASCVEKATGRYVSYGTDDELSIGLMAFVEAIKAYDLNKGNFLSFSQNIIKRRLIDYYRKEKKNSKVVSLNEYMNDDENTTDFTESRSVERFTEEEFTQYRRLEIKQLKDELDEWGISFLDLVDASPKHKKTRKAYSQITSFLLSRPEMVVSIKKSKCLPIVEIEKVTKIPRKTIERARKYIVAVIVVASGDYQYIKSYVDTWGNVR